MSKKFRHLDLSPHWQQYFSKYPQGYTIIENLIDWVSQVDKMVDSYNELTVHVDNFKEDVNNTTDGFREELDIFLGQFEDNLTETVVATLTEWQDSGFLDIVIDEALNTKYHEMDNRLTAQLAKNGMLTNFYDINTDGTSDISQPIQELSDMTDELYIQLPQGEYRWENNVHLKNKKIKIVGHNVTINNFATGTVLNIGDEDTQSTDYFIFKGIDFVNLTPKKRENGLGTTLIQLRDINKQAILRDVNLIGAEQYGLNLRVRYGNLDDVLLDNVHIFENAGQLGTTTSIALETHADGETGRINKLRVMNSSFEVSNTYIDENDNLVEVSLSNAAKIQGVDEVELTNVDFIGGLENGPLSFIYDVKKVRMNNVNSKANGKLVSSGLVVSLCDDIDLKAVNCDFMGENISSSISTRDSTGSLEFIDTRVGRLTNILGVKPQLKFKQCEFLLNTQNLNISHDNTILENCHLNEDSSFENVIILANGVKFNGVTGFGNVEDRGDNNKYFDSVLNRIQPSTNSTNGQVMNTILKSSLIPFQINSQTVSGWEVIDSTLELEGNDVDRVFTLQGDNNKISKSTIRQSEYTTPVVYYGSVVNGDGNSIIESHNIIETEHSSQSGLSVGEDVTNLKRYIVGDIRKRNEALEVWNGLEFIPLS